MMNGEVDKNSAPNRTGYAPDSPRRSQEHDELARWPFAARIADTLAHRSTPESLVVGVSGKWGEGKTTVLNFIRQRLAEYEHVVTVDFNPWLYRGREQLLISFFHQLASALQKTLRKKSEILGEGLRKFGAFLGGISLGGWVSPGDALKQMGEALSSVDMDELRKRLEVQLTDEQKRVVVLMDDIDRLDREETHAVFKLLKVAADFTWTSYVVAFDAEMVAAALGDQYGGTPEAGASFLEKIIQVPLQLPKAPRMVLRQFTLDGISRVLDDNKVQLSEDEVRRFVHAFDGQVLDRIDTPRSSKRYVNAVEFAIPLLLGEANVVDILLVEALRSFYPKLHGIIRKDRELVLQEFHAAYGGARDRSWNEQAQRILEPGFEGLKEDQVGKAKSLIKNLFPRLNEVYGGISYGAAWVSEWTNEKRAASPAYFDRYFSYGVPVDDVADSDIMSICQAAARESVQVVARLRVLLRGREEKVLDKIWEHEARLAPDAAHGLMRVIATIGPELPDPMGSFGFWGNPFEKAAVIVVKLLARLQPPSRMEAARVLMQTTELPFAMSCVSWLRPSKETPEEERTVSEPETDELLHILATRVPAAAENAPLFVSFPKHFISILYLWKREGGLEAAKQHVQRALDEDNENALALLRIYGPPSFNLTLGRPTYKPLSREAYDSLRELIDIDRFIAILQRRFPDLTPGRSMPGGAPSDENLMRDLLRLHAEARSEQARATADGDSAPGGNSSPDAGPASDEVVALDGAPAPGDDATLDGVPAPDDDAVPDDAPHARR